MWTPRPAPLQHLQHSRCCLLDTVPLRLRKIHTSSVWQRRCLGGQVERLARHAYGTTLHGMLGWWFNNSSGAGSNLVVFAVCIVLSVYVHALHACIILFFYSCPFYTHTAVPARNHHGSAHFIFPRAGLVQSAARQGMWRPPLPGVPTRWTCCWTWMLALDQAARPAVQLLPPPCRVCGGLACDQHLPVVYYAVWSLHIPLVPM